MKIKFSTKNIFRYLYALFLIINLVAMFFLYQFTEKYVYKSIVVDGSILMTQVTAGSGNINIEKFEKIIDTIDNKTSR